MANVAQTNLDCWDIPVVYFIISDINQGFVQFLIVFFLFYFKKSFGD